MSTEADSLEAKVCYGLCLSALYGMFPGIYAILAPAITDAFGPTHYQVGLEWGKITPTPPQLENEK